MKSREWVRKQWLKFIHGDTVPGARLLLLSVFAHCVVLVVLDLLVVFQRAAPVIVFPGKSQIAQKISPAPVSLPPSAKRARLQIAQKNATRLPRKVREAEAESTANGTAVQALRERAKLETAALIQNFKFRSIYGFSTGPKYQLPVQTSGEIPTISAAEVPPHFEQYVIVEVTIDTEGRVADARITAGEVAPTIEQTLLTAIREFKYRPATREGVPIPSQCDIVIHIPT